MLQFLFVLFKPRPHRRATLLQQVLMYRPTFHQGKLYYYINEPVIYTQTQIQTRRIYDKSKFLITTLSIFHTCSSLRSPVLGEQCSVTVLFWKFRISCVRSLCDVLQFLPKSNLYSRSYFLVLSSAMRGLVLLFLSFLLCFYLWYNRMSNNTIT